MSAAPAVVPVDVKHDTMTNTMVVRVLDDIGGVPAKEVIQRLGSELNSRTRKKIEGPITHVIDPDGVPSCRLRFVEPLDYDTELDVRRALEGKEEQGAITQ